MKNIDIFRQHILALLLILLILLLHTKWFYSQLATNVVKLYAPFEPEPKYAEIVFHGDWEKSKSVVDMMEHDVIDHAMNDYEGGGDAESDPVGNKKSFDF